MLRIHHKNENNNAIGPNNIPIKGFECLGEMISVKLPRHTIELTS